MQEQQTSPLTLAGEQISLSGKRVLITGGTTGIGREIARMLAAEGAGVLIFGREEGPMQEALKDIREVAGGEAPEGFTADVATKEGIEKIFAEVDARGGIDILVNNAALGYEGIMQGDYDKWQYILSVNVLGYLACTHEAAKRMEQSGKHGQIIFIGSMSADTREGKSSVYVATKSGIQGFAEAVRKELNPKGIRVSLIEPGAVDTDMQEQSSAEKLKKVEEKKMLMAEDIAAAVLFVVTRPERCDVVEMKVRPQQQLI
ncbi:SDR family oxidoreductase [Chitinophaga deserti]|uniref:SDR family oxidoreductase n=1 Tax=Chitinophaga deserti TaxID=2164099 RepID=UPI000D6B6241|nr:SDR family oxidoreductase [Chitinophaga deserti]